MVERKEEMFYVFFYGTGKNPKETYENHGMKFDAGKVYAVNKYQLEYLKPLKGFFQVHDIIEKLQNPEFFIKNETKDDICKHKIPKGIYCKYCEKVKG